MNRLVRTAFIVVIASGFFNEVQGQDSAGIYGGIYYSKDAMIIKRFTKDEILVTPFNYYMASFTTLNIEAGEYNQYRRIGILYREGKNPFFKELSYPRAEDGEIRLESFWSLGLNYRKEMFSNKKEKLILLKSGYRAALSFSLFRGIEYVETDNPLEGRLENLRLEVVGIEVGMYGEIGYRNKGEEGNFRVHLEPLYIRAGNRGLGIGGFKIGGMLYL